MALTAALLLPVPAAAALPQSTASGKDKPRVANAPAAGSTPASTRSCGSPEPGELACFARRRTDVKGIKGLLEPATVPAGYGPGDLLDAYHLPADGGAGQTIAIVDAYDDPRAEADLALYRTQFGLPPCTTDNGCFKKVSQRGRTDDLPTPDANWSQEISLDLDMVSAVAPNAHILLVEADSPTLDDLGAGVNQSVALGAKYVSNSYGSGYSATPGVGEDPSDLQADEQFYNHPGVVITASSGDSAYGVTYPAASPYVTAVGGTSLSQDSSTGRGWNESVWHNGSSGPGSGCSVMEPKPSFQQDSGCAHRTVADVSAVADPATGVAVYDSYQVTGWQVFGGTSASAPIIASTYALAGEPAAGTYPNSFPYEKTSSLNDVTDGSNGSCDTSYLCTAGDGYDGPTGLGTPNGTEAFRAGPHGTVTGAVTDHHTGKPVPGATVTMGDHRISTNAKGEYTVTAPPGNYEVKVSAFGYASQSHPDVTLTDGGSRTADFALEALPTSTVSGKVTDGSGHGYPLYARLTVGGMAGTVWTDPHTGEYSVKLPKGSDYTLHITPNYPGYDTAQSTVTVGDDDLTRDVDLKVDPTACTAAGYSVRKDGTTQTFDDATTPDGWKVTDATGNGAWKFGKPTGAITSTNPDNYTRGGSGGFAVANGRAAGTAPVDTTLTSPVVDMTHDPSPYVSFGDDYTAINATASTADVEVTVDGGKTWTRLWHQGTTDPGYDISQVKIPMPQAAGKPEVQVRFHYTSTSGVWWEMDNLFIGDAGCLPTAGALALGRVTDTNTGKGLAGAQVAAGIDAAADTQTLGAIADPALPVGFYWLYVSGTGDQKLTASQRRYSAHSENVAVTADTVLRQDFKLDAGRLAVDGDAISKSVDWNGKATAALTVTNTGTATATASVTERTGGFTPQNKTAGAPLQRIAGDYSPYPVKLPRKASSEERTVKPALAAAGAWNAVTDLPIGIQDNAVESYQGKAYSIGGLGDANIINTVYMYSPDTGAWTVRASAADARYGAAHGLIDGKIYVVGGWGTDGRPDGKLEIYDPADNTWTTGAPLPHPMGGSAGAVVDGKLYVVGGCVQGSDCRSDVWVYDPADNSWAAAPDYPEATFQAACGGVNGVLYCAGGAQSNGSADAYSYDPAQEAWTKLPNMPADLWGAAYTAADGKLLVSGGVTGHSSALTNAGYAYDPVAADWSSLPNALSAVYRGGSGLGLYRIGGATGGLNPPVHYAMVLPGYDRPDSTSVSWLGESDSKISVKPGESTTVTVTLDAAAIAQPGTYTASIALVGDTPYGQAPVKVTMSVAPPASWGKLIGTVSSWAGDGTAIKALPGATVQVEGALGTSTLTTDGNGKYAFWLDEDNDTLQVLAAKDGYQPLSLTSSVSGGKMTTLDAVLAATGAAKGASTVTATAPEVAYGGKPKVAVTVTGTSSITPVGKVTVAEGTTTLSSTALDAKGTATVTLPDTLGVGKHTLTVAYGGDSRLKASSATVELTVVKATATVTVNAPATVKHTTSAPVTVTVKAPGTVPGGKVTITENGQTVATGALKDGQVVLSLPKSAKGPHTFRAVYGGSSSVDDAISAEFTVTSN
ncbi:carboxypeptidase regulatory-like domain-containing protein [Streptomyces sp. NPDC058320]|uniref:carboxypeptidase regulatory-like domain-containing protein n=1 Tax=unclassified Streptomyces TaxID=2593676 RepID=UPI00363948C6